MVAVRARTAIAVAVLAFVFLPVGFALELLMGPDVHVHRIGGDQPAATPDTRSWALGPGAETSTTYGTTRRHTSASPAGTLRLDTEICELARVEWTVTADGAEIGRGTLSTRDWRYDMGDLELPRDRTPSALVIAARRADEADCDAELRWVFPSYDVSGIGPIWPTELSARQVFMIVFISLVGVVMVVVTCLAGV